jgi:hypothetical protein
MTQLKEDQRINVTGMTSYNAPSSISFMGRAYCPCTVACQPRVMLLQFAPFASESAPYFFSGVKIRQLRRIQEIRAVPWVKG